MGQGFHMCGLRNVLSKVYETNWRALSLGFQNISVYEFVLNS